MRKDAIVLVTGLAIGLIALGGSPAFAEAPPAHPGAASPSGAPAQSSSHGGAPSHTTPSQPTPPHTTPPPSAHGSYNGLALTPPMGWNDWSYYQCNIDESLILTQAKALVTTGLAKAGYNTVTIDDCWMQTDRDASGNLQADPQLFPHGMKYVADRVHALGLKFGIYEDAGTSTCGGYAGSWGHFTQDANLFASWGVDYVKLDGCNVPEVAGQTDEQTYAQAYTAMSRALVATHRPIVFSDSAPAYFQGEPEWDSVIETSGRIANLWREGTDTALGQDSAARKWQAISDNYGYNVGLGQYAGPGHWNDPDFLLVGDSGLTDTEIQSQMSLWAEMAAPLISSTDLTTLSPTALSVLGNRGIVAVDQDRLGVQGSVVQSGTGYDVLAKPLAGGDVSVVLFNKGDVAQTIATTASAVGLKDRGPVGLTNLVTGKTTSSIGSIAADVPAHGTVMVRVHAHAGDSAPAVSLRISSESLPAGAPGTVTVKVTDDGTQALTGGTVGLPAPAGWKVTPAAGRFGRVPAGGSAAVTFRVTRTQPAPGPQDTPLTATVDYSWGRNQHGSIAGQYDAVSNLPYPSLAAAFDNVGITSQSDPAPGNFDGDGDSYSAEQLAAAGVAPGGTVTSNGATFTWPDVPVGQNDNVQAQGQRIAFSGTGSTLAFLGAEAGDSTGDVTVTYTDGTTSTASLGFPNWVFSPTDEFGSSPAITMNGRDTPDGYANAEYQYSVFSNTVPLTAGKTVASVTLPDDADIHLFALSLHP